MQLPYTRKQATTFTYAGFTFKLSPLISKMEILEDAVGMDYFDFIDSIVGKLDAKTGLPIVAPDLDRLSILFFHLQDNGDSYTRDQIHEYLLGDLEAFGAEDIQRQLVTLFYALKGVDFQKMIQKATAEKKEAEAESLPTAD